MTNLTTRVHTALGSDWDATRSPWEGLMRLFEVDADAFYLLACEELAEQGDSLVQPLNALAHRVRKAIRASYRLVPPADGEGQVVTATDRMAVPTALFPRVLRLLMELDDKGVSQKRGKDYEGEVISEAEIRFKLGSPDERRQVEQRAQARKQARPQVFRVSQQDLDSLSSQPSYVSHALLTCVRKTILAPTAIYRGLNRGDDAPKRLREGYAICGKPNRACDNEGKLVTAPAGMVFMVYADSDGFAFDWDWVKEDQLAPGRPLKAADRFGPLVPVDSEMVLDLPGMLQIGTFDSTVATYSEVGDCIFCYITDECGYAERINSDLTVFRRLDDGQGVTGFKVKNVQRIIEEDKSIVLADAPDLIVAVDAALLATLKGHQDTQVNVYTVIIRALYQTKSGPPRVRVPRKKRSSSQLACV